ncbi:MAG TPA: M14 family zinc carboxypeptidase [Actinomycetota bacterium]|nr:M14 family zinc carboxypeptidase [Actinomycetota bacterium]
MRRIIGVALIVVLVAGALVVGGLTPALSRPVATNEADYTAYGRVFPDPHGCSQGEPGHSPFSKGNVCAVDFLQFGETIEGLRFLEELYPRYVEVYTLHEDFDCKGLPVDNPDKGCEAFKSAGLPVTASASSGEGVTREKNPLHMVRITDEEEPDGGKEYFVFPLSIHGIERAGVEGGTRAAEDLATWAACEEQQDLPVCANEGAIPHPLLEATPQNSVTAGEALDQSAVFFIYPNPDGWKRGERSTAGTGAQFFQRYNGNGVDLNRDWPTKGFTFRPYTPWSEPETFAFGKVLQGIGPKDRRGNAKWTGGIDLHGQLIDRAFSFTLMGGAQRPYNKNQRVLQTVKGAWKDAEKRLAWSPLIKPNDAPADDPRVYGVQWGTIWDSIAYTVTGDFGAWIDSPMGLNADGLDNEMSLSHLSNCGVGTCYDQDVEQLHVDGNKSLIYSMINYSLLPEKNKFRTKGRVAYVHNRGVVAEKTDELAPPPKFAQLPPQEDIADITLTPANDYTHEFDVEGPKDGVYNGGIEVTLTCANAQGVGGCALTEARLERQKPAEPTTQGEDWEVVSSYFNQGSTYVQAGQALHANLPIPGRYRVRIVSGEGPAQVAGLFTGDIDFTKEKGWPDPGQIGYRATNMKFWKDLRKFSRPRITKITPAKIKATNAWKRRFDTIVITNKVYKPLAAKLRKWVSRQDGNLVLTDRALGMLPAMKVTKGGVKSLEAYAGYVNFATAKRESTYKDRLSKKINAPGAAEGQSGDEVRRRQTYEPVPLGISIQTPDGDDSYNSPVWYVDSAAWLKAKGKQRAVGTTGAFTNVSYGEIKYYGGRIRIIGALLPMPTNKYDHPFGLSNYALTYSGYQMLLNSLRWKS